MPHELPPDSLNEIGVLMRREIEARILAPVIEALGAEFGRERVIAIITPVIVEIAHRQAAALAMEEIRRVVDGMFGSPWAFTATGFGPLKRAPRTQPLARES